MEELTIRELIGKESYKWDFLLNGYLYLLIFTLFFSFVLRFFPNVSNSYPWLLLTIVLVRFTYKIHAKGSLKKAKLKKLRKCTLKDLKKAIYKNWRKIDKVLLIIFIFGLILRIRKYPEFIIFGVDETTYIEISTYVVSGVFWSPSNWTLWVFAPFMFINSSILQLFMNLDPVDSIKTMNIIFWLLTLPALHYILKKVLTRRLYLRICFSVYVFFHPLVEYSANASSAMSTTVITIVFFYFLFEQRFGKAIICASIGFLTQYTLGMLYLIYIIYILLQLHPYLSFKKSKLQKSIGYLVIQSILYAGIIIGPFIIANFLIMGGFFYTQDFEFLSGFHLERLQWCIGQFSYPYNLVINDYFSENIPFILIILTLSILYYTFFYKNRQKKVVIHEKPINQNIGLENDENLAKNDVYDLNLFNEPLNRNDLLALGLISLCYTLFFLLFFTAFCSIRLMLPTIFIFPIFSFIYKNKKLNLIMEIYWLFYIFDLIIFD